jgi:hypothetical protein
MHPAVRLAHHRRHLAALPRSAAVWPEGTYAVQQKCLYGPFRLRSKMM